MTIRGSTATATIIVITVVINPISGTGGRPDVARQRVELARAVLAARGVDGDVRVSEYPGHARVLAEEARDAGTPLVIAWGGDGTVNEVASILACTPAALGIVPSGSGNGLARELGIPLDPAAAFDVALRGRDLVIDAGEMDGRLFFNIAGFGLDARIAHEFAAGGLVRRGFIRYLEIGVRELFSYVPDDHTIVTDGRVTRTRTLLVALANARQYGNGAVIAPAARLDDGVLDVVIVEHRSPWDVLRQAPKLFAGQIASVPGVTMLTARQIEVISARPAIYHLDGEPFVGGEVVRAAVREKALRVRVA